MLPTKIRFFAIVLGLFLFKPCFSQRKSHVLKGLFESPLLEEAQLHIEYSRADSAEILLKKFLQENHPNQEFNKWAELFFRSEIHLVRREFEDCQKLGFESLLQARKMGREDLETESQLTIGTCFEEIGDYSKTFEHYLAANDLVERGISPYREPFIYNKMGAILYQDKNFTNAITFFQKAASKFETQKDSVFGSYYWLQNVYGNLGLCYLALGNYPRSLQNFKQAIHFSRVGKLNSDRSMGVIFSNLGGLFFKWKKPELAKPYYQAGLRRTLNPINQELGHGAKKQLEYAQFLIEEGDLEEAFERINNSEKLINEFQFKGLLDRLYLVKSEYFGANRDYFNSLKFLKKYQEFQDSIDNATVYPSFTQQLSSHLLKNAHLEKEILIKEYKLQEIQKRIYAAISIVLLILGVSVFVLLNKFRKSNEQIQKAIKELKIKSQQVELANRNKDYLLQTVAHDLRTPAGNILSLSEILQDDKLLPEQQKLVSMIKQSSSMALSIMEDLLDHAQMEKGKIELDLSVQDIGKLLVSTLDAIHFKAQAKNIAIHSILPDHPILAWVDGSRLARVIQNLVTNAIKFSPTNSQIFVELSNNGNLFSISITDQGIGMESELLEEVLAGNLIKGRKGTSGEKSFGLGISICKKLIELHNGKLNAQSKSGEGSKFIFEIPMNQTS